MEFERGAVLVYPGVGVALSRGPAHHDGLDGVIIEMVGQVLFLPETSDAFPLLRAPVDTTTAESLLETIRTSLADDRDWTARMAETTRVIVEGELEDQAAWLGVLYAAEHLSEPPLEARLNRGALEDVVLSELAYVLGRTVKALSAELMGG